MSEIVQIHRRRTPLLAALEILRGVGPEMSLKAATALLYIADNDGVSVTEVAQIMGISVATASRKLSYLAGLTPALIELRSHERDGKIKLAFLAGGGRALVSRLQMPPAHPAAGQETKAA